MTGAARIVHHTPGRVRIEIPSQRFDRAFFDSLAKRAGRSSMVRHARSNPAAASLVLDYDGEPGALLAELDRSEPGLGLGMGLAAATAPTPLDTTLAARGQGAGVHLSPLAMVGAAFGAVGIVQTLRGEIMLPALSAFWYAASAWHLAHSKLTPGSAAREIEDNSLLP